MLDRHFVYYDYFSVLETNSRLEIKVDIIDQHFIEGGGARGRFLAEVVFFFILFEVYFKKP